MVEMNRAFAWKPLVSYQGLHHFRVRSLKILFSIVSMEIGEIDILRQIIITFVMGILLVGAAVTGTSFPVLMLMGSLLLIALIETSARRMW